MAGMIGDIFQGIGNTFLGIGMIVQSALAKKQQKEHDKAVTQQLLEDYLHKLSLMIHAPVEMKTNLFAQSDYSKLAIYSIALIVLVVVVIIIFSSLSKSKVTVNPAA